MTSPVPDSQQPDTGLRCPKCGYNLTAITSNTCPECGERFTLAAQNPSAHFRPPLRQLCNALWIAGTVVIILSWFQVVSPVVGWVGFAIAGVAWLVSLGLKR